MDIIFSLLTLLLIDRFCDHEERCSQRAGAADAWKATLDTSTKYRQDPGREHPFLNVPADSPVSAFTVLLDLTIERSRVKTPQNHYNKGSYTIFLDKE
jgi:hypothetical protein